MVELTEPKRAAFHHTPKQSKPTAQDQQRPHFQQPKPITKSAPSFSTAGQVPKAPGTAAERSTTPPASPRSKPDVTKITLPEKSQLVHHLVNLSLCQQGGLLQEYLEYNLPKMLKGIFKKHNDLVQQTILGRSSESRQMTSLTFTQIGSKSFTFGANTERSGGRQLGGTSCNGKRRCDAKTLRSF